MPVLQFVHPLDQDHGFDLVARPGLPVAVKDYFDQNADLSPMALQLVRRERLRQVGCRAWNAGHAGLR